MPYAREREVAVAAVEAASALCQSVQAELVDEASMDKQDKSPVTVADFGAQALVVHTLTEAFPELPLVGEEDAAELRKPENVELRTRVCDHVKRAVADLDEGEILELIDGGSYAGGGEGRHWTLDPIDGTKGFLRRDQYAVALALIEDGEVVLGVLGCPNLPLDSADEASARGCLFVAVKGEGAFMRPLAGGSETKVSVTDVSDVSRASFCESVESGHSSQDDTAKVADKLGITVPPHRIDSQCKYAAVARADASIYLRLPTRADYVEKIWDHAAGYRVVTEAGGRVTDIAGRPLDFRRGRGLTENRGVIVTNGRLHDPVLEAVQAVLAP